MSMEYNTKSSTGKRIKIMKEPDDPKCLRVSMGGSKKDGYYLVFRGDISEIEEMVEETHKAITKAKSHYLTQGN